MADFLGAGSRIPGDHIPGSAPVPQVLFPFYSLSDRLHAQLTDIIHTMHIMHSRDKKGWLEKYVLI
jgi:hypothetical protein